MIRKILAVIAGLVMANVVLMLLETAGMEVFPPPAGTDFSNSESVRAAIAQMPIGALIWVLGAQIIGTFVGALIDARIGRTAGVKLALIVGVAETIGAIANMISIPDPLFFWVASLLLLVPASYLAGRLCAKTESSPTAAAEEPIAKSAP